MKHSFLFLNFKNDSGCIGQKCEYVEDKNYWTWQLDERIFTSNCHKRRDVINQLSYIFTRTTDYIEVVQHPKS